MALSRIFIRCSDAELKDLQAGRPLALSLDEEDFRHLVHALRIRTSERFEIVVRDSWESFSLQVAGIDKQAKLIFVEDPQEIFSPEPPLAIELIFGVSKSDKNETIIRMAVEMGVATLSPTFFERSVVKLDEAKQKTKRVRFESVARHAAMQSHRARLPELNNFEKLSARLEATQADLIYVLWEEELGLSLFEQARKDFADLASQSKTLRVALLVGPEGGITEAEVALMKEHGAQSVSLGSTILRVDTANLVAVSQVLDAYQGASSC